MLNLRKWLEKSFPHKKTYIGIVIFIVIFYSLVYILAWILIERPESLNRDMGVVDFEKNKTMYLQMLECYKNTGDDNGCEKLDEGGYTFLSIVNVQNFCGFSDPRKELTKFFIIKRGSLGDTDNYYVHALEVDYRILLYKEDDILKKEIIDLGSSWFACLSKNN